MCKYAVDAFVHMVVGPTLFTNSVSIKCYVLSNILHPMNFSQAKITIQTINIYTKRCNVNKEEHAAFMDTK